MNHFQALPSSSKAKVPAKKKSEAPGETDKQETSDNSKEAKTEASKESGSADAGGGKGSVVPGADGGGGGGGPGGASGAGGAGGAGGGSPAKTPAKRPSGPPQPSDTAKKVRIAHTMYDQQWHFLDSKCDNTETLTSSESLVNKTLVPCLKYYLKCVSGTRSSSERRLERVRAVAQGLGEGHGGRV